MTIAPRASEFPRARVDVESVDVQSGFLLGANLPWLSYGGDFGSNAWNPEGGVARPGGRGRLDEAFERLRRHGVRSVRWFMLCDGRSGIRFGTDDAPLGLDDFFFRDVDAALAAAREHEFTILFVLLDFLWCGRKEIVNGVQMKGRRRLLANRDARQNLLERVIAPILERYGSDPTILGWDLMNEPEWCTFAQGTWDPRVSVRRSTIRDFLGAAAGLVHQHTDHPATVGLASCRSLDLVHGLELDFLQVHWYDHVDDPLTLERHVSTLGIDCPLLLGEFPTKGSAQEVHDILGRVRESGYAGAFFWSVLADDAHSDYGTSAEKLARWIQTDDGRRNA